MPRPRTMSGAIRAVRNLPVPPPAAGYFDEEPTHPDLTSLLWDHRAREIERSAACFALTVGDPWTARREAVRWLEGV